MKAKARPFWLERVAVSCNYESYPRVATLRGRTPIASRSTRTGGSTGGNRPIYARLTLQQLLDLEDQVHRTIAALRDGQPR